MARIITTFTWFTVGPNACKKCLALNGKQWIGQSVYDPQLIDNVYGPIYDLQNDQPLTHANCKCYLHCEVIVELPESFDEFKEELPCQVT